jgi:hypothetical protein
VPGYMGMTWLIVIGRVFHLSAHHACYAITVLKKRRPAAQIVRLLASLTRRMRRAVRTEKEYITAGGERRVTDRCTRHRRTSCPPYNALAYPFPLVSRSDSTARNSRVKRYVTCRHRNDSGHATEREAASSRNVEQCFHVACCE